MNDLKKLKEIIEDHIAFSKTSRNACQTSTGTDENSYYLFQGEMDACTRILGVVNNMIKEKK